MIKLDRIITDADGLGDRVEEAVRKGIFASIAFKRNDGWVLGSPPIFELVAYTLYRDSWTHFSRDGQTWIPIAEY